MNYHTYYPVDDGIIVHTDSDAKRLIDFMQHHLGLDLTVDSAPTEPPAGGGVAAPSPPVDPYKALLDQFLSTKYAKAPDKLERLAFEEFLILNEVSLREFENLLSFYDDAAISLGEVGRRRRRAKTSKDVQMWADSERLGVNYVPRLRPDQEALARVRAERQDLAREAQPKSTTPPTLADWTVSQQAGPVYMLQTGEESRVYVYPTKVLKNGNLRVTAVDYDTYIDTARNAAQRSIQKGSLGLYRQVPISSVPDSVQYRFAQKGISPI